MNDCAIEAFPVWRHSTVYTRNAVLVQCSFIIETLKQKTKAFNRKKKRSIESSAASMQSLTISSQADYKIV